MLPLAVLFVMAQAGGCYEGLGAPEAPAYRAFLEGHLPLWDPADLALDTEAQRASERKRVFEAVRRFIIDAKQHRAPLDELISTKRAALLRLDAYLARLPEGSQLREVGNALKNRVNRECGQVVTMQVQLINVDLARLQAATGGAGLGEPLDGVPEGLLSGLRSLESGAELSPSLGWYGQQLSDSTPPLGQAARDLEKARCPNAVEEFLVNEPTWRNVAEGLTRDQLVALSALVPRIELDVQDKWCTSDASPSITLDASGLHELAIRKYSSCTSKVLIGWLGLTRGSRDPVTFRASGDDWLPLVNSVRLEVGAPPLSGRSNW